MKLFFVIFAAVLAAAAVIWGVSIRQAEVRERQAKVAAHRASVEAGLSERLKVMRDWARLAGEISELNSFFSTENTDASAVDYVTNAVREGVIDRVWKPQIETYVKDAEKVQARGRQVGARAAGVAAHEAAIKRLKQALATW
jgi:hypothetical protein